MKTTLSVIIPVFNGEKYIKKAVDSVLNQTFLPQEILIVNDGSTDKTKSIIEEYQKSYSNLRCVHKTNGGLSSARNTGIKEAKGDFLAFLDADDLWEKTKLEKQMQVFQNSKFKDLGVVYCDYYNFDEKGNRIKDSEYFQLNESIKGNIYKQLIVGNLVASSGSGVLIKKECFEKVGFFDEKLKACEDWDMWFRIAQFYEYDFVPEKLVGLRRHNKNMQNDIGLMIMNKIYFYEKWSQKVEMGSKIINKLRYSIYFQMFSNKELYKKIKDKITPEFKKKLFGNPFRNFLTFSKVLFVKIVSLSKLPKLIRWFMQSLSFLRKRESSIQKITHLTF